MKKEQYICDICGRQYGNEEKQEKVEAVRLKAMVHTPDKGAKHHEFIVEEPCHKCATLVLESMIGAGKDAVTMLKIGTSTTPVTTKKKTTRKKVDNRTTISQTR